MSSRSAVCARTLDFAPSCPLRVPRGRNVVARSTHAAATKATPTVKIDNMSDAFATVVSVEFGDRMGEMLDTITALKNLGLNIRRAKLASSVSSTSTINRFFITEAETSEKIVKSARLEEIRLTVINSLIELNPETGSNFSVSRPMDTENKPLGMRRKVVQTTIDVSEAPNGSCSLLKIVTADRAGLLVDIVSVLKDINLNVVSAEVDTIGDQAVDLFFITYHGEPLSVNMITLTTNALQYYLSLNEVAREESY